MSAVEKILRNIVELAIEQDPHDRIEGYVLVPEVLISQAKEALQPRGDDSLQLCSVDGRAITAGLPQGRTVEEAAEVLKRATAVLGEEIQVRVQVRPRLTNGGHPFFVVSADAEHVARVEAAVNQALQEVYEAS